MGVIRLNEPVRIPVPGGKVIDEHVGRASDGRDQFSAAHMRAPAGWSEPTQTPEFDELTLVVHGRLAVDSDGTTLVVGAGQSVLIERGTAVRYHNPFDAECQYWAICLPAFSPERAHRAP